MQIYIFSWGRLTNLTTLSTDCKRGRADSGHPLQQSELLLFAFKLSSLFLKHINFAKCTVSIVHSRALCMIPVRKPAAAMYDLGSQQYWCSQLGDWCFVCHSPWPRSRVILGSWWCCLAKDVHSPDRGDRRSTATKSSTEAELVGVDDCMHVIVWTCNFLLDQGFGIQDNIVFQDNQSAMLLEQHGHASSGCRTCHINIR